MCASVCKEPTVRHQPQSGTTNRAKIARLTENKRRSRARHREYVSGLEQRLEQAREQGIQATKEVQTAAQQVVLENCRLRELLRLAGFSTEDIDLWAKSGPVIRATDGVGCALRKIEQKARLQATVRTTELGDAGEGKQLAPSTASSSGQKRCQTEHTKEGGWMLGLAVDSSQGTSSTFSHPDVKESTATHHTPGVCRDPLEKQLDSPPGPPEQKPPCKLLTRLAENPSADITQVLVPSRSISPGLEASGGNGAIPCGKAYEMLMRYATPEEKLDYVAETLERGCAANGKGGCVVEPTALWRALDNMCG